MPTLAFDGDRLLLVAGAAYGDLNANALQVRATATVVPAVLDYQMWQGVLARMGRM
jgi:hypothetical protein